MKYLYVFLASLKAKLIYRTNIVLEYGLTILQVGVSIFVWEALYSQKALVVPNYSLEKLNAYLFLANFLALSFSVAPAFRLATQIKSGRLSTLLERPISLYGEHLAYFIGDQFLGIVINLCLVVYFGALSGISVLMLLLLVIYLAFAGVMFFSLMMILGKKHYSCKSQIYFSINVTSLSNISGFCRSNVFFFDDDLRNAGVLVDRIMATAFICDSVLLIIWGTLLSVVTFT
ncbi:hypothetical protein [Ligilactobacillus murinus]|uniref:hypothetical protein n=1 Tax=Ligilactobacillus murinus TaxID=1622 RepID=UPI001F04D0DE|nr:hypothetical protein [Ligilactobacillus murinus]